MYSTVLCVYYNYMFIYMYMYTILLYTNTIMQCNVLCDGYNVCIFIASVYMYEIHKI